MAAEVHSPHVFYRIEIYDPIDGTWQTSGGPCSLRASALRTLEGKRQGSIAWARNTPGGNPDLFRLVRETRTFTLEETE